MMKTTASIQALELYRTIARTRYRSRLISTNSKATRLYHHNFYKVAVGSYSSTRPDSRLVCFVLW